MTGFKVRTAFVAAMVLMTITVGCSGIRTMAPENLNPLSLAAIKAEPARLSGLYEEVRNGGEALIKVSAGDTLPLHLTMNLPVAEMRSTDGEIRFREDAFVHISGKGVLLSPDAWQWARIDDVDALQKIFGMKGGSMSVGFEATRKDGAFLGISLRAVERR